VRAEDVHCAKNRISGMWSEEQPLWRYLEGKGVGESGDGQDDSRMANPKRTLLFAGVNTDQCVLGTLESAYNAGWDCILIEDCCATTTEWGREVCLQNISVRPIYPSLAVFVLGSCLLFFFFLPLHSPSPSHHPKITSIRPWDELSMPSTPVVSTRIFLTGGSSGSNPACAWV